MSENPATERPVCPACKSVRCAQAYAIAPRIEDGMHVCLECGCIYAFIPAWKRGVLQERWHTYYEGFETKKEGITDANKSSKGSD